MVLGVVGRQARLIRVALEHASLYHRHNDIPAQALPGVLGVVNAVLLTDPGQDIVQAQALSLRLAPGLIDANLHERQQCERSQPACRQPKSLKNGQGFSNAFFYCDRLRRSQLAQACVPNSDYSICRDAFLIQIGK
jgi:hypothetical protein